MPKTTGRSPCDESNNLQCGSVHHCIFMINNGVAYMVSSCDSTIHHECMHPIDNMTLAMSHSKYVSIFQFQFFISIFSSNTQKIGAKNGIKYAEVLIHEKTFSCDPADFWASIRGQDFFSFWFFNFSFGGVNYYFLEIWLADDFSNFSVSRNNNWEPPM